MTTEIAIMNRSAVALAADSAITITTPGPRGEDQKVFYTANKLFSLSKHAPIGLMIYGNASMLGIPWETIVKMYREHLGNREFSSLTGYCNSFFAYLDRFDIPKDIQERYVLSQAAGLFHGWRQKLDQWVGEQIKATGEVSSNTIATKLGELIKIEYERFLTIGRESVLSNSKRSSLRKMYRRSVHEVSEVVFEKIPLTPQMESQLLTIAINAASVGRMNQSGIVFAGFGTKDIHPRCQSHDVAAVFAGKTIKRGVIDPCISN